MTEIILGLIIVALIVFIAFERHVTRIERSKLVNAIVAKNATELANLDMADQTKINVNKETPQDDFVDTDDMSDEAHLRYVTDNQEEDHAS